MKFFTVNIFVVVLTLATLMVGNVFAQELTLNDCIEIALQKRASIITAYGSEDRAKADKRAAIGAFLPGLSASYGYSKSNTTDIETTINNITVAQEDQDRTSKLMNLNASMWAFSLPTIFNYFGASVDREKASLDILNSKLDLIFSVKTSYYAYLASEQNVTVQQEAVKRSEEQLKLIESKYELGSAAKSDVLKQKVQYGNDRLSLLSAENSVDEAKYSLSYTIGLDPNSDPKFSSSFKNVDYNGSLNDAMQYGLENHPGLLSAEKSVDASGYAVKSRKAEYLPRVSLTGSMNWNESTQGDTITYDFSSKSKSIGFNINWNIFDGFSRERNIAIAKIGQNNAKANLSDTRNFVAKEIKTAFLEIERLKEQKMVSQENVDASEEDLRIQQEKYNLGAAAILDLLNAQVSLKQAQVSLIRAEFDFNLAVSRLNKAMGKR